MHSKAFTATAKIENNSCRRSARINVILGNIFASKRDNWCDHFGENRMWNYLQNVRIEEQFIGQERSYEGDM